jgi:hypothetical protein
VVCTSIIDMHEFLTCKREEVHDELQRLSDLPHPLSCQDKWILTHSLQLRLQHLARAIPAAITTPHLEHFATSPFRSSTNLTPKQLG